MVEKKTRKKADEVSSGLLARIAELEERIAKLEAARDAAVSDLVMARPPLDFARGGPELAEGRAPAPTATPLSPAPSAPREAVTEEVMLVIAATVAAFLGERAHVRQVRLVSSEAWAQQGRVAVMASHRWAVHR
jgi:methylmalonyl-CoA carboxyltransferase large subunit